MEGEQTWPSDEELQPGEGERHSCLQTCAMSELWNLGGFKAKQDTWNDKRRVPPGTSEYQAMWIIEDSGESDSEAEVRVIVLFHTCECLG